MGVIAVGTALLMMPFTSMSGTPTGFADALFTAASAVTVTGLASVDTALHWNFYGHVVIALLIQIGGFGIVGFATLLGYLVDGRISLTSRVSAKTEATVGGNPDVRKLITSILKMMLFFEALLFVFLFYRFSTEYGYDFSKVGVPGLKATATYLSGDNIDAVGGDRKEWERDFRLDYVLQEGALKGLGFSWRNASLRGNTTATDADENRLIVSYSLPLL